MSVITDLLDRSWVPRMVRIRQKFDNTRLADPVSTTREELKKAGAISFIQLRSTRSRRHRQSWYYYRH